MHSQKYLPLPVFTAVSLENFTQLLFVHVRNFFDNSMPKSFGECPPPPFVLLFSMAFSVYVLLGHVFVFRNLAKYCWISSITSSVHLFLLLFGLRSFFFNTINIILIIIINVDWIQIFDIIIEVELKIQGLHCFACTSNYPPKFSLTRPLRCQIEFLIPRILE